MRVKVLVAAVLAAAVAVPAAAQSLAEIAERTRKQRDAEKKKSGGAKVITENDLKGSGRGTYSPAAGEPVVGSTTGIGAAPAAGQPAAGAEGQPAAAPAGEKPKTEEELAAERVAAWRQKLNIAQEDVTRWTAEVSRLQAALNDMTGPIYGPGRASRQAALDEANRNLATARQQVADLTEEGRRNNYR